MHGSKCPHPVATVLKTIHTLTKPDAVQLHKKNENVYPFEDPSSLEFLALKNECGVVVFGTHSKKRPNNITIMRTYDGKLLDMLELLVLVPEQENKDQLLQVGIAMKPLILFSGSQWNDTSASAQAAQYSTIKSIMLDLFQGEEISSIDVAGLQFLLMIAAGESSNGSADMDDPTNKPVLHLRWYKIRTLRSDNPKIPRVELDPVGPTFDFRVGRYREADASAMRDALRHGRRPNEARTKKNIETDLVGDKIGRVHLGKQDLSTLQTRKMKGLKRGRADIEADAQDDGSEDEDFGSEDEDMIDGGMELDGDDSEAGSSGGGTGDEISIGEDDDEEMDDVEDERPKRQRLA